MFEVKSCFPPAEIERNFMSIPVITSDISLVCFGLNVKPKVNISFQQQMSGTPDYCLYSRLYFFTKFCSVNAGRDKRCQ